MDAATIREQTAARVLEAFRRVHGAPAHKWHTQNVYVKALERTQAGWKAEITVLDDLDTCAQYDRSASWEGQVVVDEDGTSVRGMLKLTECGVARHLERSEKTLHLG